MQERVRNIASDLDSVRESLLAFADEVWQGIDYRDRAAREKTMRALDAYNEKVAAFDSLATDLAEMIGAFAQSPVDPEPVVTSITSVDSARDERIIRELDRATPHTLDEDFEYKRPYGFVLRGRAFTDIRTWKRLYVAFCQELAALDPAVFDALPANPMFISPQRRHAFSHDRSVPRSALPVAPGIFAETNLSANNVRDLMKKLLATFDIDPKESCVYLRQERDAGRDGVA